MQTSFHGIYPILYAYFDERGAPLREPLAAQVEAAVRHGAHGVAILLLAGLCIVVVNALAVSPWGTFTVVMTIPAALLFGLYMY